MGGVDRPTTASPGRELVLAGLAFYFVTTLPVLLGVWIGTVVLPQQSAPHGFLGGFAQLDGIAYAAIAHDGYWYDPGRPSFVAFFPAFPIAAGTVSSLTGLRVELALLGVTHASLLAAFVVFARYLTARNPDVSQWHVDWTLLAMGLWPWSLFFRMAYTESLFLLLVVTSMYAMRRRWPLPVIAALVGLATATRPTGVALIPVFAYYMWRNTERRPSRAFRLIVYLPLAAWGILAYMAYLYAEFGDPLVFATTQKLWSHRPAPLPDKVAALVLFKPLWTPFMPSSSTFWANEGTGNNPLVSYGFVNPIVFAGTVLLVVAGARRRWLNANEVLLSGGLLFIPYVAMAYENLMLSQPRFASVAFPIYIVMGRLLMRMPRWAAGAILLASAGLLATYSALFAAGFGLQYKILY